ncbi:hypothetical protein FHR76_005096 [Rhizobium sp. RAS22]|nr:hypothetical protein SZ54_4822 [Rhizobium sp. UR51a]MBB2908676.1 hypothetical protein [Rhizobium sp. RAS22]MDP9773604.1 hypothetical protein [Rhizobium sp. SORGH_AS_0755]
METVGSRNFPILAPYPKVNIAGMHDQPCQVLPRARSRLMQMVC